VRIARALDDELVAHAREEAPNECCGIVGARDGQALRVFRARNRFASPKRYDIDPQDMWRILEQLEELGMNPGIIYHSHTHTQPVPSQTDINLANPLFPDTLYVIVGLGGDAPDVRAWHIADGRYEQADLEVV
jgi:proteasome lid subunit RPN8/RPN11